MRQSLIISDLHSLALEDVIHERGHNQSKSDYYNQHLFIRILCHSLSSEEERDIGPDPVSEYPGSLDQSPRGDLEKLAGHKGKPIDLEPKRPRFSALSGFRLAVCLTHRSSNN